LEDFSILNGTIKELKKIMEVNEKDVDYYTECWFYG